MWPLLDVVEVDGAAFVELLSEVCEEVGACVDGGVVGEVEDEAVALADVGLAGVDGVVCREVVGDLGLAYVGLLFFVVGEDEPCACCVEGDAADGCSLLDFSYIGVAGEGSLQP